MAQQNVDYFEIKLNGQRMQSDAMRDVAQVSVDTHLYLPALFEIHLVDKLANNEFHWIDSSLFKIGTPISISAAGRDTNGQFQSLQPLIEGEVTALECIFNEGGSALLIVRGYDKSYKLHIGKKTATFLNMSDSSIVQKVVGDAGLKVKATSTSARYEYVLQNNQTDMAFLRERARHAGFELCVDEGGMLNFRKAGDQRKEGPTLEWGKDLLSFRPHISAMQQTGQAAVRGWDAKAKTLVQSQAQRPSEPKQAGEALRQEFSAAKANGKHVVTTEAALTADSAKALADALADSDANEFIKAEGMCMGAPGVRAGNVVKLTGLGKKFGGSYHITSAQHHYTARGGYTVNFCVSGRKANTLAQLLNDDEAKSAPQDGRITGVVIGVVTNNNDSLGLGRVKVKLPWLGDQIESAWCRIASPMAGAGRGFYFTPEVDDEVLVAFEQGDPNSPFVLGGLWNTADKPPKPNNQVTANGKVNERLIRTRCGHEILLSDEAGKERIVIVDKEKNKIELDTSKNALNITLKGDCKIEAQGNVNVQAQKDIVIKSAGQDISMECMNFSVKAKAKCKLEANAQLDVEGAMVGITSKGPLKVDGKPVQINGSALVVLP